MGTWAEPGALQWEQLPASAAVDAQASLQVVWWLGKEIFLFSTEKKHRFPKLHQAP